MSFRKILNRRGANSKHPDVILQRNGIISGCELKIKSASGGSLVMKYIHNKWCIGKEDETNEEKLFLINLAKECDVLDEIERTWFEEPYKFSADESLKKQIHGLSKKEIYNAEYNRFPEIKKSISGTKIEKYYNKKDSYYINVGTHGFYMLGNRNPLFLKNIPFFSDCSDAFYRNRVQYKGRGGYQFTFELGFNITEMSPYNIAPIVSRTDVAIDMEHLNLSWFL